MKKVTTYSNKKVLVMGFGISGLNAVHLLKELGANVVANDQATPKDPSVVENLENEGIKVITGSNPLSLAEEGFDIVVKNPGIPYDSSKKRSQLLLRQNWDGKSLKAILLVLREVMGKRLQQR